MEFRIVELDEDTEDALDALAEAVFPHVMDRGQKERVKRQLRRFLSVAWRGPLA